MSADTNILGAMFQGDAVHNTVAGLLLLMSVASWVVIVWKTWLLQRAVGDTQRTTAAFWQARSMADALPAMQAFDREALVWPMVRAAQTQLFASQLGLAQRTEGSKIASLGGAGDVSQQLTRVLRDALHASVHKLQSGQVLLATVGAIAPFVGLLGTVWGIYHALTTIASAGQVNIATVAGPVGEALIMTAAGLAVAIPAVLGYNILGRSVGRMEADLEGFARDLRALLSQPLETPAP
ncbi:MAG: MotA/TolQ/ExbB proton channel family protein [Sulfuritalea sp.]|nr:MotA/TolQ/ExbB proton channel family protein [Sulfuritalea sp.]